MSFFKRKEKGPLIPPVAEQGPAQPKADPYASAPAGGNRYGGGDPYARPGRGAPGGDPYSSSAVDRAGGLDNPYTKPQATPDEKARNELFAGYTAPEGAKKAERKYGYEGREEEEDFDEDDEIEGIKQEMRGIKQESLAATR
jgi:hypothetical protein